MKRIIFLCAVVAVLASCSKDSQSSATVTNTKISVNWTQDLQGQIVTSEGTIIQEAIPCDCSFSSGKLASGVLLSKDCKDPKAVVLEATYSSLPVTDTLFVMFKTKADDKYGDVLAHYCVLANFYSIYSDGTQKTAEGDYTRTVDKTPQFDRSEYNSSKVNKKIPVIYIDIDKNGKVKTYSAN